MILIKLGGSIITNKERPLSARSKKIDSIMKQIKKIKEPKIIVHGGGSYGHYWSVKYNMHTKPAKNDMRGVAIVKNSMVELNKIILDIAVKNRINAYCLPPTDFMNGNKPIKNKILTIKDISKSGLTPVTFGDALWFGQKKSFILSGDVIMSTLAKILRPRLTIFVLNVDGVYSNIKSKKLIYDFKKDRPKNCNKFHGCNWRNDKENYRGSQNLQGWHESIFCKWQQTQKNFRCCNRKKI